VARNLDREQARDRRLAAYGAEAPEPGQAAARTRRTRQDALAAFVDQHDLSCFKCGATEAEWAKTGISKRGPWAICVTCVAGRDAPSSTSPRAALPSPATLDKISSTVVYTDGACTRNGREDARGGYAAVVLRPDADEPLVVSGGEEATTNNRMEMRAVIEGLNALDPTETVEVVTDSEYVMKGFTEWMPGWIRRGWRTSSKQPVKNVELWNELTAAVERHGRVTWRWTRGHSGDRFNEMADELAEAIAAGG